MSLGGSRKKIRNIRDNTKKKSEIGIHQIQYSERVSARHARMTGKMI
jgi:hypothetical protein